MDGGVEEKEEKDEAMDVSVEEKEEKEVLISQDGLLHVSYAFSSKSEEGERGRQWAQKDTRSHQKLSVLTRTFLSQDLMSDLDFKNAYPTILLQIFLAFGIPCHALQLYVDNRESIIADIMASSGLTRKEVKTGFIKALHMGNYRHGTRGKAFVFNKHSADVNMDHFTRDLRSAVDQLSQKPMFADLLAQCVRKKKTRSGQLGRFVGILCQRVESACLATLIRRLSSHDITTHVMLFDGVMCSGFQPLSEAEKARVLADCNQHIRDCTGFAVTLVEKVPERVSREDLQLLSRQHLQPDTFDTILGEGAWIKPHMVRTHAQYMSHALQLDEKDKSGFDESGFDSPVIDLLSESPNLMSDWYVRAAWGTGKTTFLVKLCQAVEDLTQSRFNRPARIVLVSSRKSLTAQYMKDLERLGFVSYENAPGVIDFRHTPKTIWQLESLPRGDSVCVCAVVLFLCCLFMIICLNFIII